MRQEQHEWAKQQQEWAKQKHEWDKQRHEEKMQFLALKKAYQEERIRLLCRTMQAIDAVLATSRSRSLLPAM